MAINDIKPYANIGELDVSYIAPDNIKDGIQMIFIREEVDDFPSFAWGWVPSCKVESPSSFDEHEERALELFLRNNAALIVEAALEDAEEDPVAANRSCELCGQALTVVAEEETSDFKGKKITLFDVERMRCSNPECGREDTYTARQMQDIEDRLHLVTIGEPRPAPKDAYASLLIPAEMIKESLRNELGELIWDDPGSDEGGAIYDAIAGARAFSLEELEATIRPIMGRRHVAAATVFGDHASGEADGRSSVDVVVDAGEGYRPLDVFGFAEDLHQATHQREVNVFERSELRRDGHWGAYWDEKLSCGFIIEAKQDSYRPLAIDEDDPRIKTLKDVGGWMLWNDDDFDADEGSVLPMYESMAAAAADAAEINAAIPPRPEDALALIRLINEKVASHCIGCDDFGSDGSVMGCGLERVRVAPLFLSPGQQQTTRFGLRRERCMLRSWIEAEARGCDPESSIKGLENEDESDDPATIGPFSTVEELFASLNE